MRSKNRPRFVRSIVALGCVATLGAVGYFGMMHRELIQAGLAYRRGDWEGARRHAESHLGVYPEGHFMCACPAWSRLLVARSSRLLGDWATAERSYHGMPWIPVQDLRELAQYYGALGRKGDETQVYEQIRSIDSHDTDNLIALALLYELEFENHNQAIIYYREVTRLAPKRIDGWVGLANSCIEAGRHESAVEALAEAIKLAPPQVSNLHWLRGDILLEKIGDLDAAEKELNRAIALNPDDDEALCSLANLCIQKDPPDLAAARSYLRRALDADPDNQEARQARADLDRLEAQRPRKAAEPQDLPAEWYFADVAEQAGVTFRHVAGENKEKRYFPETLGGGVAILDYDGDGHLDIYFVNYNYIGPGDPHRSPTIRNTLYRNRGDGTFEDATDRSGLGADAPSHGVAVGDFDNDGDDDVYVTNYGPNQLFRNNGDGTFTDVTGHAGAADSAESLSTSAAWFDCENDGDLDLYVCNYSVYDVRKPVECIQQGQPIYCGPDGMESQRHTFFLNNGDGTFTDVTEEMGIGRNQSQRTMGKGLGLVAAHLNDDDFIDLAVANDSTPNFVFCGDGTKLVDASEASNAHQNKNGDNEACMGIDGADADGDGLIDLFVTNQWGEKNTLYINHGALFRDDTDLFGLTAPSRQAVGWGTGFVDFDRDGDLDLFVTNGHFYDWRETEPLRQKATLWKNVGNDRFEILSDRAGPFFTREVVGRGAAFGDLDNDGDTDIVLNHWNEPCAVLRNDTKTEGAWIRLELVGIASNRDAVGTRVQVHVGERTLHRQLTGGTSYLSDHDPRLLIGIGRAAAVDRLEVRWPGGNTEVFPNLTANRSYRIVEGHGLQSLEAPLARR